MPNLQITYNNVLGTGWWEIPRHFNIWAETHNCPHAVWQSSWARLPEGKHDVSGAAVLKQGVDNVLSHCWGMVDGLTACYRYILLFPDKTDYSWTNLLNKNLFIRSWNETGTKTQWIDLQKMQTSGHFTLVSCVVMTSSNGNIFRGTGLCAGNSPVTGEFPAQRPVPRSFEVFFDPRLNKPLNKQSWGWWFETPWLPSRRHCNVLSHCQGMMAELAVCYRYIFLFLGKTDYFVSINST